MATLEAAMSEPKVQQKRRTRRANASNAADVKLGRSDSILAKFQANLDYQQNRKDNLKNMEKHYRVGNLKYNLAVIE